MASPKASTPKRQHGAAEQSRGRSDHPQQSEHDREQDQRRAEVALADHEGSDQQRDRDHRDDQVPPLVEQLAFAGIDIGTPEHERQLRELRRLQLDRATERHPVLVTADRDAEPRDVGEHDQGHREQQRRPGQEADRLERHPRGDERERQTDSGPHRLPEEDRVGVPEVLAAT